MYRSRAPVRIDFAGGTTDINPFCDLEGGAVVSASINLYAHAFFYKIYSSEIRLHSLDYDKFIEAKGIRELEYDGNLDLVKAALRFLNIPSGMELRLQSDAPPGSGLGSSAAMGVALLGLLNEVFSLGLTKAQIAELEFTLETEELKITVREFDGALRIIGSKVIKGSNKAELTRTNLVLYWTDSNLSLIHI